MRQASQSMQDESTKKSPETFAGRRNANCATFDFNGGARGAISVLSAES